MIKKFLNPGNIPAKASLGLFVLRVATSVMMLTHGLPKFQRLLEGNLRFGDPLELVQNSLSFWWSLPSSFVPSY